MQHTTKPGLEPDRLAQIGAVSFQHMLWNNKSSPRTTREHPEKEFMVCYDAPLQNSAGHCNYTTRDCQTTAAKNDTLDCHRDPARRPSRKHIRLHTCKARLFAALNTVCMGGYTHTRHTKRSDGKSVLSTDWAASW